MNPDAGVVVHTFCILNSLHLPQLRTGLQDGKQSCENCIQHRFFGSTFVVT